MAHTPLSGEVFDAAEANVTRWTVAEAVKAATAKAKNDLETYIIGTREKLETNDQYQEVRVGGLGCGLCRKEYCVSKHLQGVCDTHGSWGTRR
jgi:hypothetical protein